MPSISCVTPGRARTILPEEQALALARSAARLTGLQYFQETAL